MIQCLLRQLIQSTSEGKAEYIRRTCGSRANKIGAGKKAEIYLCGKNEVLKSVGVLTPYHLVKPVKSSSRDKELDVAIETYDFLSETETEIVIHHVLNKAFPNNAAKMTRPAVVFPSGESMIHLRLERGGDLVAHISKMSVNKRLGEAERILRLAARVMIRMILDYGFLHGDLKAKNVLVRRVGGVDQPVFADFGHSSITLQGHRILASLGSVSDAMGKLATKISNVTSTLSTEDYVSFTNPLILVGLLRKKTRGLSSNPARFIEFAILFISTALIPGCEQLLARHFHILDYDGDAEAFTAAQMRLTKAALSKNRHGVMSAVAVVMGLKLRRQFIEDFART